MVERPALFDFALFCVVWLTMVIICVALGAAIGGLFGGTASKVPGSPPTKVVWFDSRNGVLWINRAAGASASSVSFSRSRRTTAMRRTTRRRRDHLDFLPSLTAGERNRPMEQVR